jgi:hypothetical protein
MVHFPKSSPVATQGKRHADLGKTLNFLQHTLKNPKYQGTDDVYHYGSMFTIMVHYRLLIFFIG